jgi:hypothetical protein
MARTTTVPPRDRIADDTPLRLGIAAVIEYPDDGQWITSGSG